MGSVEKEDDDNLKFSFTYIWQFLYELDNPHYLF